MSNKVLCAIVTSIGLMFLGGDAACAMTPLGNHLMDMVNNRQIHAGDINAFLKNNALAMRVTELESACNRAAKLHRSHVMGIIYKALAGHDLLGMVSNRSCHRDYVSNFLRHNSIYLNMRNAALASARSLRRTHIAAVLRQHGAL